MISLAFHNLFQNKIRMLISVGGVALALLLILSLDAIFSGVEKRVTAYIDHSGADIWVSQEEVFNMHMASSSLPDSIGWQPNLRLYFGSVHWITAIDEGPDGQAWYRIFDELVGFPYHVPAVHLRPILLEEMIMNCRAFPEPASFTKQAMPYMGPIGPTTLEHL